MTVLIPIAASVLVLGLIISWVGATVGHDAKDPVGVLILAGSYIIGLLMCIIMFLVWAMVA